MTLTRGQGKEKILMLLTAKTQHCTKHSHLGKFLLVSSTWNSFFFLWNSYMQLIHRSFNGLKIKSFWKKNHFIFGSAQQINLSIVSIKMLHKMPATQSKSKWLIRTEMIKKDTFQTLTFLEFILPSKWNVQPFISISS